MMEMNSQLRELAFQKAPTSELRKAARATGMKTLLMDGRVKVFKGITTPQEVSTVTQAEGLVLDT
jgi:type IV pilus assembly protein PilB